MDTSNCSIYYKVVDKKLFRSETRIRLTSFERRSLQKRQICVAFTFWSSLRHHFIVGLNMRCHKFVLHIFVILTTLSKICSSKRQGFFAEAENTDNIQRNRYKYFVEASPTNVPSMDLQSKLESGEKSYAMFKSEIPKYGICWINAVESLHIGCKELNDETQARLGLSFTNCFLEKMGSNTYPCPAESTIQECVSQMDDRAFNAYTQFFTHTQSVCFFLSNQVWQQKAEDTIHRLFSTSHKVSQRLEDLSQLQQESLNTQSSLNKELSGSRATLESFEKTLSQKHSIEQEMLNRFLEMRHFLVSEVSKFYSIMFYIACLIIFYLSTTPVRTNEARFWIFLLFAANFVLERFVVSEVVSGHEDSFSALWIITDDIDDRVWFCRKVTLVACVAVLLYFAISYRDYAVLNNLLLQDIQKQNEELKRMHFLSLSRLTEKMDTCDRKRHSSDADFYSDDSGEGESDVDSVISDSEVKFLKKETNEDQGVTSTSSDEMTPDDVVCKAITSSDFSVSPRYNLRSRSVTPSVSSLKDPVKKEETTKGTRTANSSFMRSTPKGKKSKSLAVFSSDEDQ